MTLPNPLPIGTLVQVQLPNEQPIGRVVAYSDDAYTVRLTDERRVNIHPDACLVLKQQQRIVQAPTLTLATGRQFIAYQCIVGSQAFGLANEQSDIDRRGFYISPAELHWSLAGVPEQLEDHSNQETYWEVQKFLNLALKANPNILECLFTPLIEYVSDQAQTLITNRHWFLSQRIYQSYNGYVLSQFKKLEHDLALTGSIKNKHAMHLIRLLLSGITALQEGTLHLNLPEYREQLLAIRRDDYEWDAINAWRKQLHTQFDQVYQTTKLPLDPDVESVNRWLVGVRAEMAMRGHRT